MNARQISGVPTPCTGFQRDSQKNKTESLSAFPTNFRSCRILSCSLNLISYWPGWEDGLCLTWPNADWDINKTVKTIKILSGLIAARSSYPVAENWSSHSYSSLSKFHFGCYPENLTSKSHTEEQLTIDNPIFASYNSLLFIRRHSRSSRCPKGR